MSRTLLVLRHAKSDWESTTARDFDRVLSRRGRRDAPRIGDWLADSGLIPDHVVCSPARRTRETLTAVLERLDMPHHPVSFDERVYEASLKALLQTLAECPATAQCVLLVGHNPGLDDLVMYLVNGTPPFNKNGKLMTTAAVAHITLPDDWMRLDRDCGRLVCLQRPKEII